MSGHQWHSVVCLRGHQWPSHLHQPYSPLERIVRLEPSSGRLESPVSDLKWPIPIDRAPEEAVPRVDGERVDVAVERLEGRARRQYGHLHKHTQPVNCSRCPSVASIPMAIPVATAVAMAVAVAVAVAVAISSHHTFASMLWLRFLNLRQSPVAISRHPTFASIRSLSTGEMSENRRENDAGACAITTRWSISG